MKTSLRKLVPSRRKIPKKEVKQAYSPSLPLPAYLDEPSTVFSSSIAVISAAPSPPNLPYFAFGASITSFPSPSDHHPPLPSIDETCAVSSTHSFESSDSTYVKRMGWPVEPGCDGEKRELVVKSGTLLTLEEAEAMQYVRAMTSVPVPKVRFPFSTFAPGLLFPCLPCLLFDTSTKRLIYRSSSTGLRR